MDNDTVKTGAKKIDHESSKEDVASELEEKIEDESDPGRALPKTEHAAKETSTNQRDLEKVETEIQDPEPIKVPRSQRRGLFGRFSILAEVEEPKHYPRKVKWYITFVVALAAMAAPLGSAIIFRMAPDKKHNSFELTNPSFPPSNCRRPPYFSHNH